MKERTCYWERRARHGALNPAGRRIVGLCTVPSSALKPRDLAKSFKFERPFDHQNPHQLSTKSEGGK